jgi:hypothetical protein
MKPPPAAGDIPLMSAAAQSRPTSRADLLVWQCSTSARLNRLPAADRLQQAIGPDLTRLLLVALVGDHRMGWRELAA